MTPLLTRDQILSASDLTFEIVPVPEWGGDVRVRSLSGKERDAFEASILTIRSGGKTRLNPADMRAKLVSRCIVNENGERLFTDADITMLSAKSAAALQRVFEAAQRLSGLSDQDVEELEEGLKNDQPADSPSV